MSAVDREHFDDFVERYQEMLDGGLGIVGETGAAFTERRMHYLRRRLPMLPARVLDFGCGIGLAIPHLLDAFPGCRVVGADVSPESVRIANQRLRDERVRVSLVSEIEPGAFDLAYASGVFHHIAVGERAQAASCMRTALRPGGVAVISEHNPWNPATRYLLRRFPFDEDAVLLRPAETTALLVRAGFEILARDFVSFFAGPLRWLHGVERHLHRVPLGAQYMVLARRS